jgi:hypothetical protein
VERGKGKGECEKGGRALLSNFMSRVVVDVYGIFTDDSNASHATSIQNYVRFSICSRYVRLIVRT